MKFHICHYPACASKCYVSGPRRCIAMKANERNVRKLETIVIVIVNAIFLLCLSVVAFYYYQL